MYGDVQRAMDCYRRAFEIAAFEKSSLFVSIAGLLDQMNYVQDALKVWVRSVYCCMPYATLLVSRCWMS